MSDREPKFVPLDAVALREGYLAGRRNKTDDDNPYQAGTREGLAWSVGLIRGHRKRLLLVVDGGRRMAVS